MLVKRYNRRMDTCSEVERLDGWPINEATLLATLRAIAAEIERANYCLLSAALSVASIIISGGMS